MYRSDWILLRPSVSYFPVMFRYSARGSGSIEYWRWGNSISSVLWGLKFVRE